MIEICVDEIEFPLGHLVEVETQPHRGVYSARQAGEARIADILDNITDSYFALDKEGRIVRLNRQAERMLKKTKAELLGRSLWEEFSGNIATEFGSDGKKATVPETPVQFRMYYRPLDLWAEVRACPSEDGYSLYLRDVSEEKKTQQALQVQRIYFQQLFENSPEAIVVLDLKERIVNANKAFERLFQYSLTEANGKSINELIVPDCRADEATDLSATVRGLGIIEKETVRKRKDGTIIEVKVTGHPIIVDAKPMGILAMYQEVGEQKKLKEKLRLGQKMETVGTLASGIAHDFNNILAVILAYTSILRSETFNEEVLTKSVDNIRQAVDRGASLVRQIMTFGRKSDVQLEPVDVNRLIVDLTRFIAETFPKTIDINLQLGENVPTMEMDRVQMQQILLNLCVNARDAMLDPANVGKSIQRLEIKTTALDDIPTQRGIYDELKRGYLLISVSDTGLGVSESIKKRIFEPFFTTKEPGKGTGLGLSIVHGVVQRHNGWIDVQSKIGEGTTFKLYFPLSSGNRIGENPFNSRESELPVAKAQL